MKAYVITTHKNSRLKNGEISKYPSCLPHPEVFYGLTKDEGIIAPTWYRPSLSEHRNNAMWSILSARLNVLAHHLRNYTNEDAIIMEDDVCFCDDFNDVYSNFIDKVPDNWDAIYIGGIHRAKPVEVVPDVLKCSRILGDEFVIYRSSYIPKLIQIYTDKYIMHNKPTDVATKRLTKKYNIYAPIPFFAGQRCVYSIRTKKTRKYRLGTEFIYKNIHGEDVKADKSDYLRYIDTTDLSDSTL